MQALLRIVLVSLLSLPVYAGTDDDMPENPDFMKVRVSSVPAVVLDTARQAKPGVYLIQVTKSLGSDDETYYEFDGSVVGKYWTIKVRADGELVLVSQQNEPPVIN